MRHGGKILLDQLAIQGTGDAFLVPGESFLAVLDALHDPGPIRAILCRNEAGAAFAAAATGRLTGRPGLAFVTRGPGAANAVAGVYAATVDASPMLLFVGLPARERIGRAAFQDVDVDRLFGGLAKWTRIVAATEELPESVARAVTVALSGRPGPVVVGLPEDVLNAIADVADGAPVSIPAGTPSLSEIAAVQRRLAAAERPLLLVGRTGWTERAREAAQDFATRFDLPMIAAFRCQDSVDNRLPTYVGHAGLGMDQKVAQGLRAADVIVAVGVELGEVTTAALTAGRTPGTAQTLIHIHPDPPAGAGISRPALSIAAAPASLADLAAGLDRPHALPWAPLRRDLRRAYEKSLTPSTRVGALRLDAVIAATSRLLPDDAIVASGAGNYAAALHRHFVWKAASTQLAPASGSMGYGLPAGIAAKVAQPDRPVVVFAGDGCFQMTGQELATAVQYALPIILIVADNGMHGTIRMHQERAYPHRVSATSLVNPDFAALARAMGAAGETITRDAEFEPALARALAASGPTLLHLRLDPDAPAVA